MEEILHKQTTLKKHYGLPRLKLAIASRKNRHMKAGKIRSFLWSPSSQDLDPFEACIPIGKGIF